MRRRAQSRPYVARCQRPEGPGAAPATAFLDAEDRVVARILGQARPEEVKQRLDWLTGDQSAPAPEPVVKHLQ